MGFKAGTVTRSSRAFWGSIPDRQPAVVRTLCLASLGGALEFYDFIIFAFFCSRDWKAVFSRRSRPLGPPATNIWDLCRRLFCASAGRHRDGTFWRCPRPKANIYSKRIADGDPYTTDRFPAHIQLDWYGGTAPPACDVDHAGDRDRGARRVVRGFSPQSMPREGEPVSRSGRLRQD